MIITKYFHQKEMAFAFAFDSTMSQLGPGLSSLLSPLAYQVHPCLPFLLGGILMSLAWISTFMMLRLDLKISGKRVSLTDANRKNIRDLV